MNNVVDFSQFRPIDYTVLNSSHQFKHKYVKFGGQSALKGNDEHISISSNRLVVQKRNVSNTNIITTVLILLGVILSHQSIAQRVHSNQGHAWLAYTAQVKLTQKYGLHIEGQWRRDELGANPLQILFRAGFMYNILPALQMSAGYAFIQNYPYGDFPVKCNFPEHRFWEQLQSKSTFFKWDTWLRLRLEQRFSKSPTITSTGYEPGDAVYSNRIRILNKWNYPLWKNKQNSHMAYASAFDELFVSFGKNVTYNLLDQNRIGLMLGYKLSPTTNLELGYLLQTIVKSNGTQVENNHTVNLALFTMLDLSHTKK